MSETPRRPLDGITVLDLTVALAGPYATLLLAGLGAHVIKIENPRRGGDQSRANAPYVGPDGTSLSRTGPDDVSASMLERGRNKLSVTLDLKDPRGRELFGDLVRRADVVAENYAAGTADRLGIGYAFCSGLNERIVYTAISGFGAADPGRKGMDTIFQALSGLMTVSGEEGAPPVRSGIPFGDMIGPHFAVMGTLAALFQREQTGRGQFVDVSLVGALTSMVATEQFDALAALGVPTRTGNTVPRLAPFGIFATTDGEVAICAPTDGFARGVLAAMGEPELAQDPRFATRDARVENWVELHERIGRWTVGARERRGAGGARGRGRAGRAGAGAGRGGPRPGPARAGRHGRARPPDARPDRALRQRHADPLLGRSRRLRPAAGRPRRAQRARLRRAARPRRPRAGGAPR